MEERLPARGQRRPFGRMGSIVLCTILMDICSYSVAGACTAFQYMPSHTRTKQILVAKSFDFPWSHGFATKNPRNLEKNSAAKMGEHGVRWISKYGSVTFNQIARGMPQGGMNERGLVVEALQMDGAVYSSKRDARPAISELQWVQYQLDLYASVREVVSHINDNRLTKIAVSVHYLLCDRSGECATVEPLANGPQARFGNTLPMALLANDPYAKTINLITRSPSAARGERACSAMPSGEKSATRLALVSCELHGARELPASTNAVDTAFNMVNAANSPNSSWKIVYDINAGSIYFQSRKVPVIKRVHLAGFNFSCSAERTTRLDVNSPMGGDVERAFGGAGYLDTDGGKGNLLTQVGHTPAYLIEGVLHLTHKEACRD